jgi:PAS domain S-box-containing protein
MEGHAFDAATDPYAVFFTHAPRPMYIWDRETFAFLDVNAAAERTYGYGREEMLQMTVFDVRPPEEIPRLMERLRTDAPLEGVAWRHTRKDGSFLDVELAETQLTFEGKSARLVVITDVTEREDAWRELSRSEQRFRQVFEGSPIGIGMLAESFQFLDANPTFCRMLGYTRDELCALTLTEVTYPEDRDISRTRALEVFNGDTPPYGFEKRYVRKDGELVWAYVTAAGVRDPEGGTSYGLAIIEDVSQRKAEEAEQRGRAIEALETLSQLSERERQVMTLMAEGHTAAAIARELTLSVRTVESHIAAAYRKLSVSRKEAALREYRRLLDLTEKPSVDPIA